MGLTLQLMSLAMRRDREPDWAAAAEAVDCLELATVWDTGDDLFPWEGWLEDAPNPPEAYGVYTAIRAAQGDLREAAALVRSAIDPPQPDQLLVIELPEHRLFATGGETAAEAPTELFDPMMQFAEGGIASAAGFESWSQYAARPLERRKLEFRGDDLRRVRAARAFAYAEDAADLIVGEYETGEPEEWVKRWRRPLHEALSRGDARRGVAEALMRFVAETLALIFALEEMPAPSERHPKEEVVRETVELIDEAKRPRRKSPRRVARLLEEAREPYEDLLREIAGRGDATWAQELEQWSGSPLPRALSVELVVHVLMDALFAVADLDGDSLNEIRPKRTHEPIESARPRERDRLSRRRGRESIDYRSYLAWCAAKRLDWSAAARVIDAQDKATAGDLRADLEQLREVVEGGYNRLVCREDVADVHVWLTAGTWRDGWSLVAPLRELGEHGVLDAAGAVGWG